MIVEFLEREQDWQNECTRYWFTLDGYDTGTGRTLHNEQFAIAESGPCSQVLDADGCPLTDGDGLAIAVRRHAVVTDEMRSE